jgi:hypothetical protein
LSSPWIRRPSVVDGSGIARRSIAAAARFRQDSTGIRRRPHPDVVGDAVLDALGEMTRFSGRGLDRPFLPDVPMDRHKRSCSLVEPGLPLADMLELWVRTPRRDGDHS